MNFQFDEAGNILRPKRKLPKLPALRKWQIKAREKWNSNNKGIVEAVTGSGKTIFAISIIKDFVNKKKKVLVVVPTEALLNQWYKELNKYFDKKIGLYYGRKKEIEDITVAIINSASKKDFGTHFDLLVADECHHTGARTFSRLLTKNKFEATLGISATPERFDSGFKDYMIPKLGRKIFTYSYDDALRDKVICKFNIEIISIKLGCKLVKQIEAMHKRLQVLRLRLGKILGEDKINMQKILYHKRRLENLRSKGKLDSGNKIILDKLFEYTSLSRNIGHKIAKSDERLIILRKLILSSDLHNRKIIVFHKLNEEADKVYHLLNMQNRKTQLYHSGRPKSERSNALSEFRASNKGVLVCVNAINEGFDVPDADCAIILSAASNPREIIQRFGRVLRTGENKIAKLILVYANPQENYLRDLNIIKELKRLSV